MGNHFRRSGCVIPFRKSLILSNGARAQKTIIAILVTNTYSNFVIHTQSASYGLIIVLIGLCTLCTFDNFPYNKLHVHDGSYTIPGKHYRFIQNSNAQSNPTGRTCTFYIGGFMYVTAGDTCLIYLRAQ